MAFTIPAILLTAIAGVFIDRWNKKYILITTNILRAALIALLPLFSKTLFGLYMLAFLISSVTQFFVPAEASAIPSLVKKYQLLTANSLFTTTMMASIIFGFTLGDPLINIFGMNFVHWAISGFFIISSFCLSFIRYKRPESKEPNADKTLKDFFEELKQGFIFIKKNPVVFQAMLKLATLFSMIVMLSILSISISQQVLYPGNPALGAQKFAYIIAFSGVGMVIGAFLVGKLWRNVTKYSLIYTGFIIIGINLILLTAVGLIPQKFHISFLRWDWMWIHVAKFNFTLRMAYTYLIAGIIGFGGALIAIPVQTILHSSVPEDMRGKVFGVQYTLLSTSSTLPVLIAAVGADALGVSSILMIIGVPITLFGFYNFMRIKLPKRANLKH